MRMVWLITHPSLNYWVMELLQHRINLTRSHRLGRQGCIVDTDCPVHVARTRFTNLTVAYSCIFQGVYFEVIIYVVHIIVWLYSVYSDSETGAWLKLGVSYYGNITIFFISIVILLRHWEFSKDTYQLIRRLVSGSPASCLPDTCYKKIQLVYSRFCIYCLYMSRYFKWIGMESSICHKLKCANSYTLQPDGVNLCYFIIFDPTECIIRNV